MLLQDPEIRIHAQKFEPGTAFPAEIFDALSRNIQVEPDLIHPPAHDLRESYETGMAVIALDHARDNRPIGYVRLEPLLTPRIREALGLPEDFPQIMELGTMFVENHVSYRGRGHMKTLTQQLFGACIEDIQSGKLIIIGTTKDARVLSVLQDIAGANFSACNHLEFPHVAALTCICTGKFGSGFHEDPYTCPSRIDNASIGRGTLMTELLEESARTGSKGLPCVMFVSSREFAGMADAELAHTVDAEESVTNLRDKLLELGYYPNASRTCGQQETFIPVEALFARPTTVTTASPES